LVKLGVLLSGADLVLARAATREPDGLSTATVLLRHIILKIGPSRAPEMDFILFFHPTCGGLFLPLGAHSDFPSFFPPLPNDLPGGHQDWLHLPVFYRVGFKPNLLSPAQSPFFSFKNRDCTLTPESPNIFRSSSRLRPLSDL